MSAAIRQQKLFFYQLMSLLSLIVVIAAGGGMSLVWMRQQIADSASRTYEFQRRSVEVEHRINYMNVKIAEVHSPASLERKAIELGLGLERPQTRQLVRLGTMPVRENRDTFEGDAVLANTDPYTNAFDLAVMEPLRRLGK